METPSSSHHRKPIIEWLDQLQSSVRSFSARRSPIKDPFQLNTRADESDESHDEKIQQPQRGSAGSPNSIVGLNNDLLEPDIEPYTDDAVPIGLLASLAISTSEDSPTGSAEKKGREKADDDDVVRSPFCRIHMRSHQESRIRLTRHLPVIVNRVSPVGSILCMAHHRTSACASL